MAKISNLINSFENKKSQSIADIQKIYLSDDRPWIVGYSGGKDSSCVVHLVFSALNDLPVEKRTKRIYIVSSDTLVETPLIKIQLEDNLKRIQLAGKKLNIPISTHLVHPKTKDTFWVNIIGKGYPSPNQSFRWCTDRMKIEPTNQFIKDIVSQQGEIIMLLGVRIGESNSRDRTIQDHSIENSLLMRHSTLANAYVFAPIIDFTIDDVWNTLLNSVSLWGSDNTQLFKLYSDSNSNECPLIVDKNIKETAGSCGNSRFGCWVCTVVNEDKALSGFINSGVLWLKELLDFRNWLTEIRDNREMRSKFRTNGVVYFMGIEEKGNKLIIPQKGKRNKIEISLNGLDSNGEQWLFFDSKNEALNYISENNIRLDIEEDPKILVREFDGYSMLGLGPFTINARKEMLKRLLETQKRIFDNYGIEYELISKEEIREIGKVWLSNGVWDKALSEIYENALGKPLNINQDEVQFIGEDDEILLERICAEEEVEYTILKKLLYVEKNNIGLLRRDDAIKEIRRILNQDVANI